MNTSTQVRQHAGTTATPKTVTNIHVGRVCTYKGSFHVIVENNSHSVKILDPSTNVKLVVKAENVRIKKSRLLLVNHRGSKYLVSPKGTIISMKSYRVMKWAPEHGVRLAILALVKDC